MTTAAPTMPARRPRPLTWLQPAVLTGTLVPLAVLTLRAFRKTLGANPVAEALNQLGLLALICLVMSLACTPVKILTGSTWPIRIRKTLGLMGFAYALLHFLVYAAIDQGANFRAIVIDIVERPFILAGFTALVLLVPLAWTSTSRALKSMGAARWKRLHRLAYVCGTLGVVHFFLRVKKDVSEPLVYGAILAALFAVRAVAASRERAKLLRSIGNDPS